MNVKRKILSQYYSPTVIAELSMRYLGNPRVSTVLDLAAGEGELLSSAQRRFSKATLIGIDIDKDNTLALGRRFPNADIILGDGLRINSIGRRLRQYSGVDLVVGNPPFQNEWVSQDVINLIHDELGYDCSGHRHVRTELAFLAHSLMLARPGKYLSMILPATIIKGAKTTQLRDALLCRHEIKAVIELPASSFVATEAETCILVIKKGRPTVKPIRLVKADCTGSVVDEIKILPCDGVKRLDFSYHSWRQTARTGGIALNDIHVSVVRGNICATNAKKSRIPYFHTCHFPEKSGKVRLNIWSDVNREDQIITVEKNDILIPRVGRNLLKSAVVESGSCPISDCVFRIRTPKKYLKRVVDSIISEAGKSWINAHSTGVCAKIITQADVARMPLY